MPAKSAKKLVKSGTRKRAAAHRRRPVVKRASPDRASLSSWIAEHDSLLDHAGQYPLTVDEILSDKLSHPTFTHNGHTESYDWSVLREVLESRSSDDARWFMQLRVEDLLLGPDGLDGVSVDCFVIVECAVPTLSPAEYTVKVHWPYSDAEDNAPERILPLAGQQMCWRRVVRSDGNDINVYLLQKRDELTRAARQAAHATSSSTAAMSMFGFGSNNTTNAANTTSTASAPATSVVPETCSPLTASAPATVSAFSFGGAPTSSHVSAAVATSLPNSDGPINHASHTGGVSQGGFQFGFGSSSSAATAPMFGFTSPTANTNNNNTSNHNTETTAVGSAAPAPAISFSFGSTAAAAARANGGGAVAAATSESAAVPVQPLKTSEVLFALWTRRRLQEMAKEIRSGSRIVRDDFPLDLTADLKVKLVMQNDRKDDVAQTVRRFILNRLFAKQNEAVMKVDEWTNACPVYDEALVSAVQKFRERYIHEETEDSKLFHRLCERYTPPLEAELRRIVDIRQRAAQIELDAIADISNRIQKGQLAEKTSFRLLKYYANNDVQPFRPFGKISGISEMGETVDVCVPPAHVNVNPFTGKAI